MRSSEDLLVVMMKLRRVLRGVQDPQDPRETRLRGGWATEAGPCRGPVLDQVGKTRVAAQRGPL